MKPVQFLYRKSISIVSILKWVSLRRIKKKIQIETNLVKNEKCFLKPFLSIVDVDDGGRVRYFSDPNQFRVWEGRKIREKADLTSEHAFGLERHLIQENGGASGAQYLQVIQSTILKEIFCYIIFISKWK